MCEPKVRSDSRHSRAAASTGKASSTRTEVSSTFQVKTGIRNIVMPGARIPTMVVTKLTAPRMVPKPDSASPMIHRSAPVCVVCSCRFSGAYAVQPKSAAPSLVNSEPTTIRPPKRNSQYDSMLSRGNATSGEPICSGMTALAKPAKVGVAKSSSITVPWSVNAWLYCSFEISCRPGRASSARSSRASAPAKRKKPNEVTR